MSQIELEESNGKNYKVEEICNSEVYTKKLDNTHVSGLFYLGSWKCNLEKKNTWEPALAG